MPHDPTHTEDDFPTGSGHSIPPAPLDGLAELVHRLELAVANAELLLGFAGTLTKRIDVLEERMARLEERVA